MVPVRGGCRNAQQPAHLAGDGLLGEEGVVQGRVEVQGLDGGRGRKRLRRPYTLEGACGPPPHHPPSRTRSRVESRTFTPSTMRP